jgi:RimJ/RimL family protein N-acetyltransferase
MRTERLVIRPTSEADRSRFLELFTEEWFMVFSETGALDWGAAAIRFDRMVTSAAELPFCKQTVIEAETGRVIGYVGADYFEFRGEQRLEFGYRLSTDYRGRGYATEAAKAILALARDTWSGELLAFIDPQNDASRNVLRKLEFEYLETVPLMGDEVELYRLTL